MKHFTPFLLLLFSLLFLASCVNNQDKAEDKQKNKGRTTEIKKPAKAETSKPVVTDETPVSEKPSTEKVEPIESKPATALPGYSVYEPHKVSGHSGRPLVIFLDPHANGNIPVALYKNLAEDHGFLLIGSNEIRSGMSGREVIASFDSLFQMAKTSYPVDQNRIYLMGFSGGARVALAFAEAYPEINAVIASGAGIQAGVKAPGPTFSFMGMAGNEDFNMIEIINTDRSLKRQGFNRAMIIFDGDHNWPPVEVAEEAFQWLDLVAMKEKTMPGNPTKIKAAEKWYLQKTNSLKNEGRIFDSYEVAERGLTVLDGLTDLSSLRTLAGELRKNPVYKEQLGEMVKTIQLEMGLQNNYMQAFAGKDMEWWTAELQKLNETGTQQSEQLMKKRLLAFLGVMAYMISDRAVNEKDIEGSAKYLEIYRALEPANPEHFYLEAKRRMIMEEQSEAINYLKLAIVLGFNDKERLNNEPAFIPLQSNPEFIGLLE